MTAISCRECGQPLGGNAVSLTMSGHVRAFCSTSCLREWLAEATA